MEFEEDAHHYATLLAEKKGEALVERFPDQIILTADTVVHCEGKLYNKPADEDEARRFLEELSGKWLEVISGVSIRKGDKIFSGWEETGLLFEDLDKRHMEQYHNFVHFLDKSGAFAIEKGGSLIVKEMRGCFYNVLGLPINRTKNLLLEVGIDLWEYL